MNTIFVCSPYSGDIEKNTERAKRLCKIITENGFAPFAPHLFCTQFLDEETDRSAGMKVGLQWLERADEVWVCTENITPGMEQEVQHAIKVGKPIRFYHDLKKRRFI